MFLCVFCVFNYVYVYVLRVVSFCGNVKLLLEEDLEKVGEPSDEGVQYLCKFEMTGTLRFQGWAKAQLGPFEHSL